MKQEIYVFNDKIYDVNLINKYREEDFYKDLFLLDDYEFKNKYNLNNLTDDFAKLIVYLKPSLIDSVSDNKCKQKRLELLQSNSNDGIIKKITSIMDEQFYNFSSKEDLFNKFIEFIKDKNVEIDDKDLLFTLFNNLDSCFFKDLIKHISANLLNDYEVIKKIVNDVDPRYLRYINKKYITKEIVKKLLEDSNSASFSKNHMSDFKFYRLKYQLDNKVLLNTDDIDLINELNLKKKGNREIYIGLCPFHDDRNPSFYYYKNEKRYRCFSCGKSGTTRDFICSKYKDVPFIQELLEKDNHNFYKNDYYYCLYYYLPQELKLDKEINEIFLNIDGCILKMLPQELKYNEELVDLAIKQDITAFRYIVDDKKLVNRYIKDNILLEYYLPNKEKSKDYLNYIEKSFDSFKDNKIIVRMHEEIFYKKISKYDKEFEYRNYNDDWMLFDF